MEDGRHILARHERGLVRRRLCAEVGRLVIVVLGTRVRLLANDDAAGVVVRHGLGHIILLVLVLVRYHGHGVLARKRRRRELGYHARGGVGQWLMISLLSAPVGTTRTAGTRPIAGLRKSVCQGGQAAAAG